MNEREDLKKWLIKQDRHSDNFQWIYYNFRFYYLSSDHKIWSDSRGDCEQRGANLVIINNKEEQEFLQKAITSYYNYNYWIGLSKNGGVWKWVDDTTLTLRSWMNEYLRPYKYSCAVTSSSGWAYKSCDLKNRWICEKRILQ
ncbi:C-type lectin domain family 4 member M-like [Misgurnus anguillicaudatus]|uniref:C-type lectin domain family 4 member M-like n=1 Tax=Misgurnus anguillicaudatus TaxID=75329 RepID=UPI003CCF354B